MKKLKHNIDKDWLIEQYVTLRKSTTDIAKEIGCGTKTIRDNLLRFGVILRNNSESHLLSDNKIELLKDYSWLYEQYCDLEYSPAQIGKHINCGARIVIKALMEHNISIRDICEAQYKNDNVESLIFLKDKEWLNIKYQTCSMNDIAKELNVTPTTVMRYFKKHNIKRRTNTETKLFDVISLIEDKDWLFEQYIILGKTAQQISQELNISDCTIGKYLRKHEIEIKYTVGYSMKCIQWLESIIAKEGVFIQHAMNGGEYQIPGTRFKVDGYCKETNTCYEFHGDIFHGNPDLFEGHEQCHAFNDFTAKQLYDATIERENKIISLGYNLVVMWENDFNKLNS
jgi:hypothetical protein